MSDKPCCEYHDALPDVWQEAEAPEPWSEGAECGLAGMGTPAVCCSNCPQAAYFVKRYGITPDFAKDIMALPPEERP